MAKYIRLRPQPSSHISELQELRSPYATRTSTSKALFTLENIGIESTKGHAHTQSYSRVTFLAIQELLIITHSQDRSCKHFLPHWLAVNNFRVSIRRKYSFGVTVVHQPFQSSSTVLAHFSPSPLWCDMLYFVLPRRGSLWSNTRRTLVPAFTSGNRLCCCAGKCTRVTLSNRHRWAQTDQMLPSSRELRGEDGRRSSQ